MTGPSRENWPAIIMQLEAVGISVYKISIICNRRFNTVKHWKLGHEPKHHDGQTLLAIHAEYVVKNRSFSHSAIVPELTAG